MLFRDAFADCPDFIQDWITAHGSSSSNSNGVQIIGAWYLAIATWAASTAALGGIVAVISISLARLALHVSPQAMVCRKAPQAFALQRWDRLDRLLR